MIYMVDTFTASIFLSQTLKTDAMAHQTHSLSLSLLAQHIQRVEDSEATNIAIRYIKKETATATQHQKANNKTL